MKIKWMLFLLLAGIAFCAEQFIIPGCIFNGDFPLYIKQAESINTGDAYLIVKDMNQMINLSTYQRYSPILYPWGYPLIIALPISIWGVNYFVFSVISTLCLLGAMFFLYLNLAHKKESPSITLSLIAMTGLNTFYLYFCDATSSDLPYLFFVALSFYILNRIYTLKLRQHQDWIYPALGVLLFFTAQIRTEGYFLFISLFALQYRMGLQYKDFLPYLAAFVCFLLFSFYFPNGYIEHFSHFSIISTHSIISNLVDFFQYPGRFLSLPYTSFSAGFWLFATIGIYVSLRIHIAEIIFTLSTISLLIFWPHGEIRYWICLFPFCLFFFMKGLRHIPNIFGFNKWSSLFASTIIIICFFNVIWTTTSTLINLSNTYTSENPDITSKESTEVFDFIRANASPQDIIACGESRAIYLYTGHISCNLSGNIEITRQVADWYVEFLYRGSYLQYSHSVFRENKCYFKEKFRNKDFIIYKIIR